MFIAASVTTEVALWLQSSKCHPAVSDIAFIATKGVHCSLQPAGCLQCQATAVKLPQPHDRLPESPDISMLGPELQQEWMSRGTCIWVQSGSSHTATSGLYGNATNAATHLDNNCTEQNERQTVPVLH